jgi:hypothetical protein
MHGNDLDEVPVNARLRRPVSYSLAPDIQQAITALHERQQRSRSQICEELILAGYRTITGSELRPEPEWVVPAR